MHSHFRIDSGSAVELWATGLWALLALLYSTAAVISGGKHKPWPLYRHLCWYAGLACAAASIAGPIAARAHDDFTAHMIGHLLLGMLAPLLIALASPMRLLLRTLPVVYSRRIARILKSRPIRLLHDPVIAAVLNVGGLWALYTTDIYLLMQHHVSVHALVHLHLFLAGYLFTVSIIYIDPMPYRTSFMYRAVVLVTGMGAHAVLSKHLYARPPAGVPTAQAEAGSMLMYYGGDAIEIMLVSLFCWQWFKASRLRMLVPEQISYRK
ncbi:cytochrome c oxidase assembly protein [Paenibacillus thiaminolyticus]|uniref:Cytochrome c oxidase assembly protein n=1 Tax=Paenibacillus thiaminolyticus TaxID=49283 RepID=A0A3A3GJZ4_PANTH|nr:cytochrome c oxidase assembly protein [Paenibacillus thiaminolyticus]RJG23591.1 cytochrome c oxidase assembly protein [Paenibacillus thiaminolyticus]